MKAKKWVALLLSGAMALSVGALAACKKDKDKDKDKDQDQEQNQGGDYTVDTTEYYLAGDGAGTLKKNGWSNTNHELVLVRDETADHNVFKITISMYAGDEFKIVHDDSWDGEMGITFMYGVDEEKNVKDENDSIVFAESGAFGGNICLQTGHDGVYTFSLHTYPDDDSKKSYITYTKDEALKALLDMYIVSDMNDFGYKTAAYAASHMTKKEDGSWKALLKIEAKDLKRDAEGNKVTEGAEYAAVAVRNDVKDDAGVQVVTCDGNRTLTATIEGDEYNLLPAGAYTLIYNPAEDTLTIQDGATEMYFVGNFTGWQGALNKVDKKYLLTEDSEGNWGGYLTITEDDYVENGDHAELKLVNPYENKWYSDNGDNNISLTAGDYFFKFTTAEGKVEYEEMAYYIVGSIPDELGGADDEYNFKLKPGTSIKLYEGETEGVYEVPAYIPDCSGAYSWVAPNAFAFKVVYGTYLGGARDWHGDGDNNIMIPEEGEYTISYNTETKEVKAVRITYTVTFDLNYENATGAPAAQKVDSLKTAEVPTAPTREDHTFLGWYKDEACNKKFDFESLIERDTTLYARWELTSEIPAAVTVTFDLNYPDCPEATTAQTVNGLVVKPEDPTSEDRYFKGWYDAAEGGNPFDFNALVGEATTLYAYWNDVDKHVYHIVGGLKSEEIKSWDPTDVTLKLEQDPAYPNENVFTITLNLFAGDEFKILGLTDTEENKCWNQFVVDSWALYGGEGLVGAGGKNIKVTVSGTYRLTFFRDGGWKLRWVVKPIVIKDDVYFTVNGVEGDKLSVDGDEWKGYVTVKAGDEVQLLNKGDYSKYDVNITEAGDYFVKVNLADGSVNFEKCEYYIVGTLFDSENNAINFSIKAGSPKMTLGEDGVYSVELVVTDVTETDAYKWMKTENKPGIFAIKVAYGTTLADGNGVRGDDDWHGNADESTLYEVPENDNIYIKAEGTYIVTYDPAEDIITVTLKNA